MAKKIKLEITEAQLLAIMEMTDESSSMLGGGEDEDKIRIRRIMLIDRILKKHGYKRAFT